MRIGTGYDVHRLTEGRDLIIGGVQIPYQLGLDGHSDADVLLHAVMDALLGAAALGDIGKHFPDTDPAYKGISSLLLLEKTAELLQTHGFLTGNIDATIIAQKPKMAPYIPKMRENIARVLKISVSRVNVKATTEEGLGFTGQGLGIAAQAVCLLEEFGDISGNDALYEMSYDPAQQGCVYAGAGAGSCANAAPETGCMPDCPMRNMKLGQ